MFNRIICSLTIYGLHQNFPEFWWCTRWVVRTINISCEETIILSFHSTFSPDFFLSKNEKTVPVARTRWGYFTVWRTSYGSFNRFLGMTASIPSHETVRASANHHGGWRSKSLVFRLYPLTAGSESERDYIIRQTMALKLGLSRPTLQ